jgi:hypothetical protein
VIVVGFANMIADTLSRVTITSSLLTLKRQDPLLSYLIPGNENMFMLGLSIQSLDLSYLANLVEEPQFFSLQMRIYQLNYGVVNFTAL